MTSPESLNPGIARYLLTPDVRVKYAQDWKYETDEFSGICVVANEPMVIRLSFECRGRTFFDVIKINAMINELLRSPVSVEGMAEMLALAMPGVIVTATGRAISHGWISSRVCV